MLSTHRDKTQYRWVGLSIGNGKLTCDLTTRDYQLIENWLQRGVELFSQLRGKPVPANVEPVRLNRNRRPQIISILADGPARGPEIARRLGLTRSGAMKWINRMIDEGILEGIGHP